ncbi:WD40 repeat domain-containing protein [Brevibacillus antibioticus]|uniref:WD40 repeat domain-containing protein n=1 Tax=Brevibacillus antibioticus TaxID=2570228 RepID=A0A4U2Y4Q1_9BACL|nr:WD40 repeat domain-containing protein [Brevibacillus antibioticus]TKI55409.1 WD40 repeat domain-containing protein [Brevibacillus antibioticus]
MTDLSEVVEQAERWHDDGKFLDALLLLTTYIFQEKTTMDCPEEYHDHIRGMYLYIEALLHTGRISEAKQFVTYLRELQSCYFDLPGVKEEVNELQYFMESILPYFQSKWDQEAAVRSLGRLSDRDGLDPGFASRCQYYLALADYRDYNVVDARQKLTAISGPSSSFFNQQLNQLHRKIDERSRLDFHELRRQHRAFIEIGEHDEWVENLCLNTDGSILAVMYRDGMLKLLSTSDGTEIASFEENISLYEEEKAEAVGLAFSPDSRYLAVGLGVGIVKVYDVEKKHIHTEYLYPGLDWEQLAQNSYYREYTHVSFSENGTYLVLVPTAEKYDAQADNGYPTPDYYGSFYVIEVLSGELVLQHTYHGEKIAAIQISPDEKRLAVALFGKDIAVWDLSSSTTIAQYGDFVWLGNPSRMGMIDTIAFTKDSSKLVYAAKESFLIVFDIEWGFPIHTISLERWRNCCALFVDNQDAVVVAEYVHSDQSLIRKWQEGKENMDTMFSSANSDVNRIVVCEERDEIWIYSSPFVELRRYSTSELIKKYDPYQWSYSRYVIYNAVSINEHASIVAISHGNKIRLG